MLFHKSKKHYALGFDFGTQSIKAVELELRNGKPFLVNYGRIILDNSKEALDSFDGDYGEMIHAGVRVLLDRLQPHTTQVNVAIPAYNGLVMTVDFPRMTEKELAKAIQFESRKYIPTSLDDVNVSWEIIDKDDPELKEKNITRALLVAAPKSEVEYYDHLFHDTGLSVHSLELETFSLARLVKQNNTQRILLVDIGAKTTNIVLIDRGVVRVNRNVDVGGINLTQTIADRMKISLARAREMKESHKNFLSGNMAVVFPSLNYIVTEIQRIVSAQKTDALDQVILAGGTAKMVGLVEYFATQLNTPCTTIDPMAVINSNQKDRAGNPLSLDISYSVATGLALQEFVEETT